MKSKTNSIIFIVLVILVILFLSPIFIVLMNSFKGQFYIADAPFVLPDAKTYVGIKNYINGVAKINFFHAFGYSLFITVGSVLVIVFFTSMTAWYITRVKTKITSALYYLFVFSMIVPFQMVMFTMSKVANVLRLDNPVGIIFIYLGFGAGLSVFMFSGFIKSIPKEIEEASVIDGCSPIQTFFSVVFPILPYLLIGNKYRTIPIAVQFLQGGYGSRDMGALMAMLVLSIVPIIVFYLTCQRQIIEGVVAGAVKG